MEIGKFEIEIRDEKIFTILSRIADERPENVRQFCERFGEEADKVRYYDVYFVDFPSGTKVLKKTEPREAFNYETYLAGSGFSVPHYYGKWEEENEVWILIEFIQGNDLRNMTDELALSAADTLSQIQNAYWQADEAEFAEKKTDQRFEVYWQRILKRMASLDGDSELQKAYQLFADRQMTCPRTLSNGDLLEYNGMHQGSQVYVIDWECGGIMPYSLDIARFIAHGTEDARTFPFYMSGRQKKLFVDRVYEKLEHKPNYEQYLLDIKLSVLNEYIGCAVGEEDFNRWYQRHAAKLAGELLNR